MFETNLTKAYPKLAKRIDMLVKKTAAYKEAKRKKKAVVQTMEPYDVIARGQFLEGLFGRSPGSFTQANLDLTKVRDLNELQTNLHRIASNTSARASRAAIELLEPLTPDQRETILQYNRLKKMEDTANRAQDERMIRYVQSPRFQEKLRTNTS